MSASEFGVRHRPTSKPAPSAANGRVAGRTRSSGYTLTYDESMAQVPWQTDNKYIQRGYRRQLSKMSQVAWSLIGYWHNETVNIHTHLVGAVLYLILIPLHFSSHLPSDYPNPLQPIVSMLSFRSSHPQLSSALSYLPINSIVPKSVMRNMIEHTIVDTLALSVFLVSAVGCLTCSWWFHAVQCMSKERCESAHRGDYIGIVVLIVGSFWPCLYYGFKGYPVFQIGYVLLITALGGLAAWTVLRPGRATPSQIWHRTLIFIALGASAVVPVGHLVLMKGWEGARKDGAVDWIAYGGGCYIFGAILYAARIPEKLSPGTFDLLGSSHQIFHCFVLAGSWCHYTGIRKAAGML